jgi:hypothetical protein
LPPDRDVLVFACEMYEGVEAHTNVEHNDCVIGARRQRG